MLLLHVFGHCLLINSLWPSDAIWQHRSGSTLVQVMACCLMAPSHYLNQCWLIISKVQWHSFEGNFTIDTSAINHWNYLENYLSKILFKSPRGQWVKAGTQQTSFRCRSGILHDPIHLIWVVSCLISLLHVLAIGCWDSPTTNIKALDWYTVLTWSQ